MHYQNGNIYCTMCKINRRATKLVLLCMEHKVSKAISCKIEKHNYSTQLNKCFDRASYTIMTELPNLLSTVYGLST